MSKKWMAMLMSALLIVSLAAGASATAPSKTTEDLVYAARSETTGTFGVSVVANDPLVQAVIKKIEAFLGQGGAVVNYFPDGVKSNILGKFPSGTSADSIVANEIVSISTAGYDATYGDVVVTFGFATVYPSGAPLAAVAGVIDGQGNVEWIVLDASAVGGQVQVSMTKAAIEKMATGSVMLAILSLA